MMENKTPEDYKKMIESSPLFQASQEVLKSGMIRAVKRYSHPNENIEKLVNDHMDELKDQE